MFGYWPAPKEKPKPAPLFREDEGILLMFCHVCGCTYSNYCPSEHRNVRVRLKPGREGFVIG